MNVFIIGCGFTKALFPDAPLNRDLLRVLADKSSAVQALRDRYSTVDIEAALTKLDVDLALYGDDELRKLREEIESELAAYFSSFCASKDLIAQSPWLSQFIDDVVSSGDVAISLNYDCVLEGALDCRGKWSPNGGYGSIINNPLDCNAPKSPATVLKIHGSANFIIFPFVGKPARKTISFDFDERFFPRSAENKHLPAGAGTGKSYVIAPSYVKIPTVEVSYLMIDALRATTKAENLLIIGSSLRPEDSFLTVLVTNFLRQPTWQSRRIIVVDPYADSICERLKDYWGVNVTDQILPVQNQLQTAVARLAAAIKNP